MNKSLNTFLLMLLSLFCVDSIASDSILIQKNKHFEVWFIQSSEEAILFIAGGSYKGKEKPNKRNISFTHNLIWNLNQKDKSEPTFRYKTSAKSKRFLGIIRNSIYSLKFGDAAIPVNKLRKGKHRAMRKVIKEINAFYKPDPNLSPQPLTLIGSSYGSVVAAQFALQVIEKNGGYVKTIILTASPINQQSNLGKKLQNYHDNRRIKDIVWLPNPNDNVSGASGKTSLWKLIFPSFSSGTKSVLNPHHPHNRAAKDLGRTPVIIDAL